LEQEVSLSCGERLNNLFLRSRVANRLRKLSGHHLHFNVSDLIFVVFKIAFIGYVETKEEEAHKLQQETHSEAWEIVLRYPSKYVVLPRFLKGNSKQRPCENEKG